MPLLSLEKTQKPSLNPETRGGTTCRPSSSVAVRRPKTQKMKPITLFDPSLLHLSENSTQIPRKPFYPHGSRLDRKPLKNVDLHLQPSDLDKRPTDPLLVSFGLRPSYRTSYRTKLKEIRKAEPLFVFFFIFFVPPKTSFTNLFLFFF